MTPKAGIFDVFVQLLGQTTRRNNWHVDCYGVRDINSGDTALTDYSISPLVHKTWPTLTTALAGAGLVHSERARVCVYDVTEASRAQGSDIILESTTPTTVPYMVSLRDGHPARVGFAFQDMAFGHALLAELIRANPHPAYAEPATAALLAQAERAAQTRAPILIEGETGAGKEGMSRFVHDRSPRADRPFVAINCAALPETMAEAMLFGHQKGSFTGAFAASEGLFQAAHGGTLLLDEVSELPLTLQAKLLRALQEGEVLPVGATRAVPVDVRIIAAANRDLAGEVEAGRFRADLYWRLNVLRLVLRPLRARRQDIRAISAALLIRHARAGSGFAWPTTDALDVLLSHDWPGNVRELDNVVQRALLTCENGRITERDLQIEGTGQSDVGNLSAIARRSQADAIRSMLSKTGGHRGEAAAQLGVSERTLRYRLAEMRIAA